MPVTINFIEDGHIIHIVIGDPWKVSEIIAIYPLVEAALNKVHYKIHTLADVSKTRQTPSNIFKTRLASANYSHSNTGIIAVVGASPMIKVFAETLFWLARYDRARFFTTYDDALNHIREVIAGENALDRS
jgi:hypothetical protein